MIITQEWMESIQDEQGLTRGQVQLLGIWAKRQAFVGYNHLPDRVANFLMGCKGYRGPKDSELNSLSNQRSNHHIRLGLDFQASEFVPTSEKKLAERFKRAIERLKQYGVAESEIFHPSYANSADEELLNQGV